MSKARGLADLGNAYSDGALSNRNMIINGGMQVAQRSNRSPGGFSGSFYAGPDRWLVNRTGTGTTGFSQVSSTSYGGTKAAQATFLAAAGEAYVVTQRIEDANIAHLAGQQVTLSFWVSGSSDAGSATLNATLSYASAPDDFTTETTISSSSVSYSGSAAYYTFTFTLPSGAANGVGVKFEGAKTDATGTFTLTFGGVQLEVGDTATPFEHRSYGDELARCQRYYQHVQEGGFTRIGVVPAITTNREAPFKFTTEMRASPSVSVSGGTAYFFASGSNDTPSSSTAEGITIHGFFQKSSGTPSRTAGGTVAMDNWLITADAEL